MKQSQNQHRKLYKTSKECTFGCKYCFAKFRQFDSVRPPDLFSTDDSGRHTVVYPTCDGEFFADRQAARMLERAVYDYTRPLLVSISVKSPLNQSQANWLNSLNAHLSTSGRGIIKCGVSISGKSSVAEYEPRTPSYKKRLDSIRSLSEMGVPTSLNLKPIMPFVPVEEYLEIVEETAPFSTAYLVGGLYLDPESTFGKEIEARYPNLISNRRVDWLPSRPTWRYCENQHQIDEIGVFISQIGRYRFDTDFKLMRFLAADAMRTSTQMISDAA